jgi:hypothetical protein
VSRAESKTRQLYRRRQAVIQGWAFGACRRAAAAAAGHLLRSTNWWASLCSYPMTAFQASQFTCRHKLGRNRQRQHNGKPQQNQLSL